MITEILSTLKIYKLTKEQYDKKLLDGTLDETSLYLTPDEAIDLSPYATIEQIDAKADVLHVHENATSERAGFLSSTDKAKLDGLDPDNIQINIDDKLDSASENAVQNKVINTAITDIHTLIGDTSVADQIAEATQSKADLEHAHTIDNISGLSDTLESKYEKPSSGIPMADLDMSIQNSLQKADTAIQSLEGYATEDYVQTQVGSLVDSAPETLNTLNELAVALGQDPNFATTVANQIGTKVDKVEGKCLSTNDYTDADKQTLTTVNDTVSTLSALVGDTSVATQITEAISVKSDNTHKHDDVYDVLGSAISALAESKAYTDGEIAKMSQVQIITWEADD